MLRLLTYGLMRPNKMLGSHRVPWTLVSSGWNQCILVFWYGKLGLFCIEISFQCVFLPGKHVSYTFHLWKLKLSKVAPFSNFIIYMIHSIQLKFNLLLFFLIQTMVPITITVEFCATWLKSTVFSILHSRSTTILRQERASQGWIPILPTSAIKLYNGFVQEMTWKVGNKLQI